MNCPNCGAGAYQDNLGRWFCNMQCGWNSGYTYLMGVISYAVSSMWRQRTAGS